MRLLPFLAIGALLSSPSFSAESDRYYPTDNAPRTKDLSVLRSYLKKKREEPLKDKEHALSITGEVRPKVVVSRARRIDPETGVQYEQYGGSGQEPTSYLKNRASLFFDYRVYQTSFHVKLKFENPLGVISGSVDCLTLEQAYMRQRVLEDGKSIFDISIGRNKLYNIFDSKLQFNALLDGVTISYQNGYPKVFDLQLVAAGGVISQQYNLYGWVGEIGLSKVLGTGMFMRYSFTDWMKKGTSPISYGDGTPTGLSTSNNPQFAFQISQFTSGWNIEQIHLQLYWATVYNNAAKPHPALGMNKLDRVGWYVGFQLGQAEKKGDMAIEANYQWLGAQAVPGWDMAGIGNGNPSGSSIYYPSLTGDPAPFGNTNYRGFAVNYMSILDDNLSLVARFVMSQSLRNLQNWRTRFTQVQMALVYCF
jgi:hypothetical protein